MEFSMRKVLVVLMGIIFLAGCTGVDGKSKKPPEGSVGLLTGALIGGLVGSVAESGPWGIVVTVAGILGGGYLGYQLELNLNKIDRQRMQETTQMSLENTQVGVTNVWDNPDTGHFGTVTPTRTFRGIGGEICRDFSQTVEIDGERYQATGTACREKDGLWLMEEVEA